ncbi:MAG: hypothetical protein HXX20_21365, partial [Chloroflexi bacterium]|nr:hypothetical protein [Chloroflexota bacterium]
MTNSEEERGDQPNRQVIHLQMVNDLFEALTSQEAAQEKAVAVLEQYQDYLTTSFLSLLAKLSEQAEAAGQTVAAQNYQLMVAFAKGYRVNLLLEKLPEGKEAEPYQNLAQAMAQASSAEELQAVVQLHSDRLDEALAAVLLQAFQEKVEQGEEAVARHLLQLADLVLMVVDAAADGLLTQNDEEEDEAETDNEAGKVGQLPTGTNIAFDPAPYLTLLQRLQKTEGNIRQTWRALLLEHLTLLDNRMLQVVEMLVEGWHKQADPDVKKMGAGFTVNFAVIVSDLPRGNRKNLQELVLGCYRQVLTIFTLNAFPEDYAMTQNNLGT